MAKQMKTLKTDPYCQGQNCSSLNCIFQRYVWLHVSTVGRRAFPVALHGARIWNDLRSDVNSSPAPFIFQQRLKMHLFVFVPGTIILTVSLLHLLWGPCSLILIDWLT